MLSCRKQGCEKKKLFDRVAQALSKSKKQFSIERLKALKATTFEWTTNPANVEKWLSMVEKCLGKFTKLAKYTTSYVVDEDEKCKRFEDGLRMAIRVPMMACTNWPTFSKLVEVTMRFESALAEEKKSFREKRLSKEPTRMRVASHSIHEVS
ncbi:zf-CCHC domain-containing protein [Cucumis melo var. makuwa]|uniref:Zf-CCHC domain-containing protein n=1 Tax=Cucumis melo var. makuwa TaxID=1194695 RepID=A0A5A7V7B0_CUCMM|nr:zf-CCHC domain-containing protein [Cucumis melo var. makuwa]